ncbi:MAG: tRNA lysidine(34) synthetase TilS [Clostridia bacterium]|nr:tRNA lysidine(34) synthetase TilS [Clostridia bacterium]
MHRNNMNNINKVLAQRIEQYAQRYGMLDCTDLVVGYSGGADSSLLLYVLCGICRERDIRLYAAHVNHMLRGDAADADEEFCRKTCARLGVEFCSLRADVRALSRERAQSEETCARDVRYGFFEQIKGEIERCVQGARVHIATAHNSTDNAETVLFNLTRGSAISGVTGIPPIRDSYIVRPILCLSKDEVLGFCGSLGIDYVTDATNAETIYTRNRIRHNVLPELRRINPALEQTVFRMCESVREDADYLELEARSLYASHTQGGARNLTREMLLGAPAALRSRELCYYFEDNGAGYEHTHIESAVRLCLRGGDFSLSLIGGQRLVCERDVLRVELDTGESDCKGEWECTLTPGENILPRGRIYVCRTQEELEAIKTQNVYNLFIQQKLSGDTISNVYTARCRREGDVILSGGHRHKVKKLFSDMKIPQSERGEVPLVCRDGQIVWIPRVRTGDTDDAMQEYLYFAYTE